MATGQDHEGALVQVEFTLPSSVEARSVAVAGDFNGWSPSANPLTADETGTWRTTVALAPGRHRFRYVLDGHRWENDWAADEYEANELGEENSIRIVLDPGRTAEAEAEAVARETSAEQLKPDTELVAPSTSGGPGGGTPAPAAPATSTPPQTGGGDGRELQQGSGQPSPSMGEQQQRVDPS